MGHVRGPAGEYMLIYADREAPDILCRGRGGVLSVCESGPGVPSLPSLEFFEKERFFISRIGRRRRAGPAAEHREHQTLVPSEMPRYVGIIR